MSTQPTLTWEQYQQLPPEKRSRPLTSAEYAALTRQQRVNAGLDDDESGAPANFSGPVFSNPDHVQISEDSDSGIPATRLPNGVNFNQQNFNGRPQMDASNPAAAQVVPAQMQTVAAQNAPDILPADFQKWDAAPDTLPADFQHFDAEKKKEETTEDHTGWLDKEIPLDSTWHANLQALQNIGRGIKQAGEGAWQISKPPSSKEEWVAFTAGGPVGLIAYRTNKGLVDTAKGAAQVPAAIHDVNQSADPLGVYGQVAGRTAGEGAGQTIVALATEGTGRGVPKVAPAFESVKDVAKTALNKTAKVVRAVDPDVVGIVSPRAAHSLKVAQRAAKVAEKYTAVEVPASAASEVDNPAESFEGVPSPQTEAASETSVEHVPEETPAAPAKAKVDTSPASVEKKLNDALGGKPLQKNVPLKSQGQAASLPEGFTPIEKSSLIKGYKYDPATQEFDAVTHDGQHYRHGQVSPEQFKAFEDADSKGAAWNKLRQGAGVTPLGKVDSAGKLQPRIQPKMMRSVQMDPETGQPEFSDVLEQKRKNLQEFIDKPKTPAAPAKTSEAATKPEADLTAEWQKSLDQIKAGKGGVRTNADPEMLTKRWGVTEKSLKESRAQTRGWEEAESEAEIKKLEARYRKGEPVQPVMETRDANNNIINVDGRGRAIAARRAGIKRIPVIVRRLQ